MSEPGLLDELDPQTWQRIESLFHQAMALPAAEREQLLQQECGGDSRLYRQVTELLAVDQTVEERVAGAIQGTFQLAADEAGGAIGAGAPSRVGIYRVLSELGRGGMSTVYLAERDDHHFHKQVAVKVLHGSLRRDDFLDRLRQERQILARLEHPHIARLLDGGNTADGLPYLVMEYVRGQPIDAFCDRQRLSVEGRLELFLDVCSAVQYAHRSLVIHRDLKPTNLLVTDEGEAKLLDFGIAKLLQADEAEPAALPTATGIRLLTPEYASPEQVRGEPLTTASDVYSLGVLLYELLTGRRPYRLDRTRHDVVQVVCHSQPERPSAATRRPLGESEEQDSNVLDPATARATTSARLRRRLAGDLDIIVLEALRKEPQRRYASVDALAADLRRHLAGQPISARPDSWSYLLGKFVGRHRWAVAASAAVLLLMTALVGFYTVRLTAERDRAQREQRRSAAVVELMTELFQGADPATAQGDELTARELLDYGAMRLRSELSGAPQLRAQMLSLIGSVYLELGLYDQAGALLAEAETARRELDPNEPEELAESRHLTARWLLASGRAEEAEALHREALDERRRRLGEDQPAVADSLTGLGDLLFATDRPEAALEHFRQALEIRRAALGEHHAAVGTSLNDVGAALTQLGRLEPAENSLRRALSIRRAQLGDAHPAVAVTLSNLAAVRSSLGDPVEAAELSAEVLALRRRLYGDDHPLVADSLNNLGYFLGRVGDDEGAEKMLREAVEILRRRAGDRSPVLAESLANLAEPVRRQGRWRQAEQLVRESLEITRSSLGDEHRNVAPLWMSLGDTLLPQDKLEDAEAAYRQALVLRQAAWPADHWRVASPQVEVARVLLRAGQAAAAEQQLGPAVEALVQQRPGRWRTGEALVLYGECLARLERYSESRDALSRGLQLLAETGAAEGGPAAGAHERARSLLAELAVDS